MFLVFLATHSQIFELCVNRLVEIRMGGARNGTQFLLSPYETFAKKFFFFLQIFTF
jgi:hypothetical protein